METSESHSSSRRLWLVALVFGILLVGSSVAYAFYASYEGSQAKADLQSKQLSDALSAKVSSDVAQLSPILTIKVYDSQGHLIPDDTRIVKHDLLTNIFINWLAILVLRANGVANSISATTIAGSVTTLSGSGGGGTACFAGCWWNANGAGQPYGGYIEVGTGTTAAARTDTALQTPFQAPPTQVSSVAYDPATGNVTIATNVVANTGVTISESGLISEWSNNVPAASQYLISHDVFTGIVVGAGSTIAIQYTIELLNTGFTNNFGLFLDCVMSPAGNTSPAGVSGSTTTAGSAANLGCYYGAGAANNNNYEDITANIPWIAFGTGTTATARSQYTLATSTSTCSNTPTVANSGATTTIYTVNLIKVTTSLVCTVAQTISEAALFGEFTYSGTTYLFMLWRTTFTGVAVSANQAFTVTFQITVN